jgi:hypothetical protein
MLTELQKTYDNTYDYLFDRRQTLEITTEKILLRQPLHREGKEMKRIRNDLY